MTDETRLVSLLRSAVPPVQSVAAPTDLWARVVQKSRPTRWSWIDLAVAAGATLTLLVRPDWILLLAYHF